MRSRPSRPWTGPSMPSTVRTWSSRWSRFGPDRQAIPASAWAPDATIVAVDYDMCVPASVVADAALFLVDDRGQFLANRTGAGVRGLPGPGRHDRARRCSPGTARPASGPGGHHAPGRGPRGRRLRRRAPAGRRGAGAGHHPSPLTPLTRRDAGRPTRRPWCALRAAAARRARRGGAHRGPRGRGRRRDGRLDRVPRPGRRHGARRPGDRRRSPGRPHRRVGRRPSAGHQRRRDAHHPRRPRPRPAVHPLVAARAGAVAALRARMERGAGAARGHALVRGPGGRRGGRLAPPRWRELGVAHERLTADDLLRRWPQIAVRGDLDHILYEPDAGALMARKACLAVAAAFQRTGGSLRGGRRVMPGRSAGRSTAGGRRPGGSGVVGRTGSCSRPDRGCRACSRSSWATRSG